MPLDRQVRGEGRVAAAVRNRGQGVIEQNMATQRGRADRGRWGRPGRPGGEQTSSGTTMKLARNGKPKRHGMWNGGWDRVCCEGGAALLPRTAAGPRAHGRHL